jgi:hypothetical protein
MEPIWNGLLTCDYERTRPAASLLEWDIYTTSLIRWPQVLMDHPRPYGRLRRVGIVDIDQADHEELTGLWCAHLADPRLVADMITRTSADRAQSSAALGECDRAVAQHQTEALASAISAATAAFLRVSSTHIVNWLLPEQRWEALLTGLLGTRPHALACLSALQFPDHMGHILADHASRSSTGTQEATVTRSRACATSAAWRLAALTAAGDTPALPEVRALTAVLAWAAESEERRNELRRRFLDVAASWRAATGRDTATITTTDLLGAPR